MYFNLVYILVCWSSVSIYFWKFKENDISKMAELESLDPPFLHQHNIEIHLMK